MLRRGRQFGCLLSSASATDIPLFTNLIVFFDINYFLKFLASATVFCDNCIYMQYYFYASFDCSVRELIFAGI